MRRLYGNKTAIQLLLCEKQVCIVGSDYTNRNNKHPGNILLSAYFAVPLQRLGLLCKG